MGGLATEPVPKHEPVFDRSFVDRAELAPRGGTTIVDLPPWYASMVAPPTRDEPPTSTEAASCSRLFWRATVARWPIDRRQAWGDRANALQDAGFDWIGAERMAFEELMADLSTRRR